MVDKTYLNQALILSSQNRVVISDKPPIYFNDNERYSLCEGNKCYYLVSCFFVLVISDACVIPIYKRKSVSILMHLPIGIKNIGCVEAQICIDMLQSYSLLAQIQEFV